MLPGDPRKEVPLASSPLGPSTTLHSVCVWARAPLAGESSHHLWGQTLSQPATAQCHSIRQHILAIALTYRVSVIEINPSLALMDGIDFVYHCMLPYNNQTLNIPAVNTLFNRFLNHYFFTHLLNI